MVAEHEKGKLGEQIACDYLISKGYKIKVRNYLERVGEIDIIAYNDMYLAFVEVKTRRKKSMVSPAEAVNLRKQSRIIKTALLYMMKHSCDKQPRFDVIEVYIHKTKKPEIYHIENAFTWRDEYAIY